VWRLHTHAREKKIKEEEKRGLFFAIVFAAPLSRIFID
jgi:hypothetical protein